MIDESQLIEAVRYVKATEPDRIYHGGRTGCTYLPNARTDSTCGCLIGEALVHRLGVPAELLERIDDAQSRGGLAYWGGPVVIEVLAGWLTPEALRSRWVQAVQQRQDNGATWAEAVEWADAEAVEWADAAGASSGRVIA